MGKLANSMLKIQAKDMLRGITAIQNGHATTNDVMMTSHLSHAMAIKELGMTARTGYRTIDHVSGVDHGMPTGLKIALWIGGVIVASIGGYYVWSWVKRKKQVANVQTTQTTQGNNQVIQSNNQQQEVKALPPGQTLGSFNWAGFRHDVLNTMMTNTKDLLDYAIQQAKKETNK
jgi:hypothetical protein